MPAIYDTLKTKMHLSIPKFISTSAKSSSLNSQSSLSKSRSIKATTKEKNLTVSSNLSLINLESTCQVYLVGKSSSLISLTSTNFLICCLNTLNSISKEDLLLFSPVSRQNQIRSLQTTESMMTDPTIPLQQDQQELWNIAPNLIPKTHLIIKISKKSNNLKTEPTDYLKLTTILKEFNQGLQKIKRTNKSKLNKISDLNQHNTKKRKANNSMMS